MKHAKKASVRQSKFIQQNGFDPGDWMVVKDTSTEMWIVARKSESLVVKIPK